MQKMNNSFINCKKFTQLFCALFELNQWQRRAGLEKISGIMLNSTHLMITISRFSVKQAIFVLKFPKDRTPYLQQH
jgi:hypothetical protein